MIIINKSLVIICVIILCHSVKADPCIESIRAYSLVDDPPFFSKMKIDISDYINTTNYHQLINNLFKSIDRLNIQCNVSNLYQPQTEQDAHLKEGASQNNNIIIPIKAGMINNIAWVIYLSTFDDDRFIDTTEGLALSIVTFSNNGQIIDAFPLSTFILYDGFAEKSMAEIQNGFITIYLQEIDYFNYDEKGERGNKLDQPLINNVKTENYLIENGLFKLITRKNLENN